MDIIRMYFDMKRDEAELQAAFAHFKQCEDVKSWYWKFHDNDELHSRGVGQYYAMLTLKAAMPDSVRDHGLGNQAKMPEHMEGFLAWSMKGQDNMVWKSAAMNMMSFMGELHTLASKLPRDDVPKDINDAWDILSMMEKVVTMEDERRIHV